MSKNLIAPTEKRVLNIEETAKVLGIGTKLVRKQIKAGIIPSLHLGRIYRVPIVQLNAFLAGEGETSIGKEGLQK